MAKVLSPGRPKRKRRPPNKASVIMSAANIVILLAVVLCTVPLAIPRAFGYQPYTVVSGSMEPAIPIGSLVYVKNQEPDGIGTDEVAAFYKNGDPGTIIIHRVVENDKVSGQLTTKGDANAEADFEPVAYSDCIGRVEMVFKGLGSWADMLTSSAGKKALFFLIGLAAAVQVAANALDRRSRRKGTAGNNNKEATT